MGSFLTDSERCHIEILMRKDPECQPRRWARLIYEGNPTPEDLLDIEVYLRQEINCHCMEVVILHRLFEDYTLRRAHRRRIIEDPTIQEKDRCASWAGKIYAFTMGSFRAVAAKIGRIRSSAVFR